MNKNKFNVINKRKKGIYIFVVGVLFLGSIVLWVASFSDSVSDDVESNDIIIDISTDNKNNVATVEDNESNTNSDSSTTDDKKEDSEETRSDNSDKEDEVKKEETSSTSENSEVVSSGSSTSSNSGSSSSSNSSSNSTGSLSSSVNSKLSSSSSNSSTVTKPSSGSSNGSSSSSSSKPSSGSSSSGTGSSSSASSSSSGSSSSGSSSQEVVHNWVPITTVVHHDEVGHWEEVVVSEAWTEEVLVYETVARDICNGCGEDITGRVVEHIKSQALAGNYECGGHHTEWKEVQTGTNTINHPAVTEKKWVVDKAAWDETVTTGYKCTIHGETK